MPIPVQNLMRQARTSRIASTLTNPPVPMPPTPQPMPPVQNQPWITYQSLMRSAGLPIDEHIDPMPPETMAGQGGFEEPPLPVSDPGGDIEPGILPGNTGPGYVDPRVGPVPHSDPYGIDPGGNDYPGQNPFNHWNQPRNTGGNYDPASGIGRQGSGQQRIYGYYGSMQNAGGGYVPNYSGPTNQFTGTPSMYPTQWSFQPGMGWVPRAEAVGGGDFSGGGEGYNSGGSYDQPRGETTAGRLLRMSGVGYGIPQIFHSVAEAVRRGQNRQSVGGRLAAAGRNRQQAPVRTAQAAPPNSSGALTPRQYQQQTFGGLRGTGYRSTTGSATFDNRAAGLQLMASQAQLQPRNAYAPDSPTRRFSGVWRMNDQGEQEQVGERTTGARGHSGLLINSPEGIANYNRLALLASRGA